MPKPLDAKQLPRVRELFMLHPKLSASDLRFAQSLQDSFRAYGKLSDKQMEWVEKLITRATAPPKAAREPSHSQAIPGFKAVEDLLYHAAQFVAFPCIRLRTEKDQHIQLRPRPNERAVTVHTEDYCGVYRNEVLDMSYLRFLADPTDVLNTLHQMAAHPLETAILYGKKYKSCCFCGIGLTDARSIVVGYGPICAGNYGLPWGEKDPEVTVDELEALMEAQK